MNEAFSLDCAWCGERQPTQVVRAFRLAVAPRCERCNGPLKVRVDVASVNRGSLRDPTLPGLWAWFDFLPIADRGAIVSLGEGNTPIVPAPRLARRLGLDTLLLKDETRNPTGSFKDRMLSVGVSRAVELGKKTVAVQSSGNVGAAAAAYAARAGLHSVVFVPRNAPDEKLLQAQMHGAEVVRIDHDSPA
jgi:threonine synthase